VQRVHELFRERTALGLRAALASFPTDGLSVQDLIDRARSGWIEEPFVAPATWLSRNGSSGD
jgi:hypothetical protein